MTQTEKEAIKRIVRELANHIGKIEDFIEAARNSNSSKGTAQVPAYIQARVRSRLNTREIERMLEEM